MSSVIMSTIFDFGLESKLRLLQEETVGLLKKSKDEKMEDITEVTRPEILWMKSGNGGLKTEIPRIFVNAPDFEEGEDSESLDSDSDTLRNESEVEDNEEGYFEEHEEDEDENDLGESCEEGIFEWKMTTIIEEPEPEEDDDEDKEPGGEEGREQIGESEERIDASSESSEAGGTERGIRASTPKETGISTEREAGESGTPAEDHFESSTSADDNHDSPTVQVDLEAEGIHVDTAPPCDLEQCTDSGSVKSGSETITALQPDSASPSSISDFAKIVVAETKENNKSDLGKEETGMHSAQHQRLVVINNNGTESRLRSVLRKPGNSKGRKGRCVTFNESLNLFYDAECSCWVHEDDYARYRQEEFERRECEELYQYEPLPLPVEYEEPPTLSPPEGYKDRFFPQEFHSDPDVTRVSPPSPPTARRKVFLRDPGPGVVLTNGQEEEVEEETNKKKGLRLGGILKGGRLWRSNSSDGKKVISPPEEPDVVKCTESSFIQPTNSYSTSTNTYDVDSQQSGPTKVSIGTAPLRTSEQIRLVVDSTLRSRKNKKPECSTLVEKLRWLTSLEDEDSDSNQSGFATWPSPRDKNGLPIPPSSSASAAGNPTRKSDAGTSTCDEHFVQSAIRLPGSVHEARIKQISYTLEDIEEGLKGTELELESFVTKDGARIERIRKRYGEEGGDDYGFSRRPSVKGIKPKFSSTNQIFVQFTNRKSMESPALGGSSSSSRESEYENTRLPAPPPSVVAASTGQPPQELQPLVHDPAAARTSLAYEFQNAPGRQSDESRAHFEMIRQSFEQATAGGAPNFITNYSRPHSWSVSTLPHPHHIQNHHHHVVAATASAPHGLPLPSQIQAQGQPLYGTVRRVPNVIGRPVFLHYGALSVEAHPNKIPTYPVQQAATTSQVKVPETPSPTNQQAPMLPIGMRYYGPPIRYYNQPPPVPPRTVTAPSTQVPAGIIVPAPVPVGINNLNMPPNNPSNHSHPHVNVLTMNEVERGVPEGATDEDHLQHKEAAYSMNV